MWRKPKNSHQTQRIVELWVIQNYYMFSYMNYMKVFEKKQIIRGRTMWDQTYGCAKKYRCSIAYYLMSYLSTSYQFVLDRAVDTSLHKTRQCKQFLWQWWWGMFTNLMTRYGSFIYIFPIQSWKIPRLLQIISIHYWQKFLRKTNDKRYNHLGLNIWMRKEV